MIEATISGIVAKHCEQASPQGLLCPQGFTGFQVRRFFSRLLCIVSSVGFVSAVMVPRPCMGEVTAKTLVGDVVTEENDLGVIDRAIERFRNRDIDGCRATLERACDQNNQLPPPGVIMAKLWLSANQLAVARAELEDTAVKFPADPEPYLMLGDLAFQDKRFAESALLFKRAEMLSAVCQASDARKNDFHSRCCAGLAAVAEHRKDWSNAEKYLQDCVRWNPGSDGAHYRLGVALVNLERPSEAVLAFRKAQAIEPQLRRPETIVARLYEEQGKKETAKEWRDVATRAAINEVFTKRAAIFEQTQKESQQAKGPELPAVWQKCLGDLVAIRVGECPDGFREAWEKYLIAVKDKFDLLKNENDPAAVILFFARAGFTKGQSAVEDADASRAISDSLSDAWFNLILVAKRYGVE